MTAMMIGIAKTSNQIKDKVNWSADDPCDRMWQNIYDWQAKQKKLFMHTLEKEGGVFVCRIGELLSMSTLSFTAESDEYIIVVVFKLKRNLKKYRKNY